MSLAVEAIKAVDIFGHELIKVELDKVNSRRREIMVEMRVLKEKLAVLDGSVDQLSHISDSLNSYVNSAINELSELEKDYGTFIQVDPKKD